ncbi:MAG: hypothetical protein WC868_02605 [Bacteroidales bacterium]
MKKLFQILFFVLYPLIIYSQQNLSNESNSTGEQFVADTKHTENLCNKSDSTRKLYKLGVGFVFGFGGGGFINIDVINNLYNKNELRNLQNEPYRPYSFPYLQFTMAKRKLYFQSIGLGYKNTSVDIDQSGNSSNYYTQQIKSFRIYYQYDLPLIKTKTLSAILYTGINCSANIQDFEFSHYTGGVADGSNGILYNKITFKSFSDMVALNLPFGYRKRFWSSSVWFDCGINLKLISYEHINYNYEEEYKNTGAQAPGPILPPTTYGNGKKDKICPISFSPYLVPLNGIYFKIIFI